MITRDVLNILFLHKKGCVSSTVQRRRLINLDKASAANLQPIVCLIFVETKVGDIRKTIM